MSWATATVVTACRVWDRTVESQSGKRMGLTCCAQGLPPGGNATGKCRARWGGTSFFFFRTVLSQCAVTHRFLSRSAWQTKQQLCCLWLLAIQLGRKQLACRIQRHLPRAGESESTSRRQEGPGLPGHLHTFHALTKKHIYT